MTATCKCVPPAGVPSFQCRHFAYFVDGVYQSQKNPQHVNDASFSGVYGVHRETDKDTVLAMINHEHFGEEEN